MITGDSNESEMHVICPLSSGANGIKSKKVTQHNITLILFDLRIYSSSSYIIYAMRELHALVRESDVLFIPSTPKVHKGFRYMHLR